MQKELQKTCLIISVVLNLFLPDWAKEVYEKDSRMLPTLCQELSS